MTDYMRELNKGMKVFSQLYVGLKDQGKLIKFVVRPDTN